MKTNIISTILCCLLIIVVGCNKFLDEKSKSSLAVPKTLKDLQALMDYELYTVRSFPIGMDVASDYYFMNDKDVKSLAAELSDVYLLNNEQTKLTDWTESYKKIMYANIVLDNVDQADLDGMSNSERDLVKGTALFHRGWNLFWLAQEFSQAYEAGTAKNELGIPLRTTSDINVNFQRTNLEDTFLQITKDLRDAAGLLPNLPLKKTRPSKAAAYAVLARVFLYMGNVSEALNYANLSLAIQKDLIDYRMVSPTAAIPFELMNKEVIFHSGMASSGGIFTGTKSFVDTVLFEQYNGGDLRKTLYYKKNANGFYNFKGNYAGTIGSYAFCGLAVDELYLIKAECEARSNQLIDAGNTMVELLKARYETSKLPIVPAGKAELIDFILSERKKELAFRFGTRWSDIKRLNKHYNAGIRIVRNFDGKEYILEPNDKRFALLIPYSVVVAGGLVQNPR
ncbi:MULTISPECIES: RagB/SusD family nutrient uptake outer membrane protein [Sphingobacterium]|uniref:RagB/SusD family nutrient uptake outer membrane protein n=1 Tax=Sphingobacterium TaxID=28453 RepID=UPI000DD9C782|nr:MULTISPECIES: RagB/SusD family nutrient uptake outer membrane protein [Sphingobacterium]QQT60542.1 RagB/SusD family nutrient uptake outer membrane protein [Sphingobacterium multivorum]QRQ62384.1 RagB/SusD family nutrient uptake outer membrane protein [Sphingobacterium multivorum]